MFQSIWVYHITYHPSQYCSIHALDLGLIIKNIKISEQWQKRLWPDKGPFWCFADFQRDKWIFPLPIPLKECFATARETCKKRQIPQLLMNRGRGRCVDCLVLWNIPFEDTVSTILSLIVGTSCYGNKNKLWLSGSVTMWTLSLK